MNVYPRQKLSSAEKNKRDAVTGKTPAEATIDFFIDETIQNTNREEILSNYRLLEGDINERDYDYVLNPLNTTVDRYKRFGSKLRNFDIITPVINLYLGEFSQRFKNVQVIDSNPNDDNRYKEGLNNLIKNYYAQETINNLNALGIQTGKPSQEQPPVKEQVNEYNLGFDANRVISGQAILDYITFDQDLDDKYQDAYEDWLKAGMTISYKGVAHNDVEFEIINPWEVTIPNNARTNFIEDEEWIVRRQVWTPNQILDRWNGDLTDEEVSWLEEEAVKSTALSTGYVRLPTQWISNDHDYKQYSILNEVNGIEVYHVQHRSMQKMGILTHKDDLGQIVETEVDDTYTLNKDNGDISIEWQWISEVREGWRIGEKDRGMYKDVRPLPYNRMELNNKSAQKLSYNGRINRGVTGKLLSIVSAGKPYQLIYNILHYQFEKIINKNKDKIAIIPQGLIPKGVGGWDEEKFMYYAHANSMMVLDETSPTAAIALQGIKVLDMSLGNFAKEAISLMQEVKAEWWEAIGMNRQRYGDSNSSDGKGVTEQAIYRSAIISEELNRKFEKFQEKDYGGLLDISKVAYLDGKKAKYINSVGREAFLKINADDAIHHLESDYNIHVLSSKRETEKITMAKQYAFNLGQNGETVQMLELIDSNNFQRSKEIITKIDANLKQREADMQQAAQQSSEAIAQSTNELKAQEFDMRKYEADKKYDTVIDSQLLKLEESGTEGRKDPTDIAEQARMNNHKIDTDNKKTNADERLLNIKDKEANARIKALKAKKTAK